MGAGTVKKGKIMLEASEVTAKARYALFPILYPLFGHVWICHKILKVKEKWDPSNPTAELGIANPFNLLHHLVSRSPQC